jgi:hypothetical protein
MKGTKNKKSWKQWRLPRKTKVENNEDSLE